MDIEGEDIGSLMDRIETDDVGQKRYLMYQVFDRLLERAYSVEDAELPETEDRVAELNGVNGYLYKLAQEFLTSSSTLEKQRKLEKMVEHVTRGLGEPDPEWSTEKEEFEG